VTDKKLNSTQKYQLPKFLDGRVDRPTYIRWLQRKATAHVKRDRKRVNHAISIEEYKMAIHRAVERSAGADWYTGESLDWEKISTYDNEKSKKGRSEYKATFALLPTVNHVLTTNRTYDFVISSWRANDSKNDLSLEQYIELCWKVVSLHGDKSRGLSILDALDAKHSTVHN
jgi:hypothetical protein